MPEEKPHPFRRSRGLFSVSKAYEKLTEGPQTVNFSNIDRRKIPVEFYVAVNSFMADLIRNLKQFVFIG